jgi:hypothetical protein
MKHTAALLFCTLLFAVAALAQPPMPKPGPEQKKLEYFVGNWTSEGDMKPGPMGPGGKMTVQEESTMMEGGFFVVIRSAFTSVSMGNGSGIAVMGYDPFQKVYTYNEFNSWGEANQSKGTVDGDTWTWLSDIKAGPQTMKGRFTMKILSPTSYTYKFEVSPDGTKWDLVMDGKDTKNK